MQLRCRRSAAGASAKFCLILPLLCAFAVAGCNTTSQHAASGPALHGRATVAFDSIDGPPRPVFDKLVQGLNTEAQERRLAIVSRDTPSAYRVRGYLGAASSKKQNSVSWVWDVYDQDRQRVLRITGEEKLAGKQKDAWQGLDDAATRRIARASMEQLAAFLATADGAPPTQMVAYGDAASPEASGIFPMPQGKADPLSTQENGLGADQTASLPERRQRASITTYQVPSEPPKGTN